MKKQFRRRVTASNDVAPDAAGPPAAPSAVIAPSKPTGPPVLPVRPQLGLSFEDDDDGIAPIGTGLAPKKKKGGLGVDRAAVMLARAAGEDRPRASTGACGGGYSAESLRALHLAQRGPSLRATPSDGGLRLTGSFKPVGADGDLGAPAPLDHAPSPHPPSAPPVDPPPLSDGATHIPDAGVIAAAKQRREKARAIGSSAHDYVSLTHTHRGSGGGGHRRDGDDDDSGDEAEPDARRLVFISGGEALDAPRPADGAEAMEGDDDVIAWEDHQMRTAVGGRPRATVTHAAGRRVAPPPSAWAGSAENTAAVTAAAEAALSALATSAQRLAATAVATRQRAARASEDAESSRAASVALESAGASAAARYRRLQSLSSYIADLAACLHHKSPLLDDLEAEATALAADAVMVAQARRVADDADMLAIASASIASVMAALGRGASVDDATAAGRVAGDAAARVVASGGGDTVSTVVDEFGRDVGAAARMAAQRRAVARDVRRSRRSQRRRVGGGGAATNGDGSSIDDDDEEEDDDGDDDGAVARYVSGAAEVSRAAGGTFDDVADAYATLPSVAGALESWKRDAPGDYRDAYAHLAVPSLVAPYVRAQLLACGWSPVGHGSPGPPLHTMDWHATLFNYGQGGDAGGDARRNDDADLVPALVAMTAAPRVEALIAAGAWDPSCPAAAQSLASTIAELGDYRPATTAALESIVAAACDRVVAATRDAAHNFPSWPPSAVALSPPGGEYIRRRFHTAVRALAAAGHLTAVLPPGSLMDCALEGLLASRLVPHVTALAAHAPAMAKRRAARILAALSPAWRASPMHPAVRAIRDLAS